ncbi:MAG: hypothetical protein K0R92_386 [Lachnospiraceae bacterium]|jgi:DNA-binding XRE family transcriptional regulator|nr:hypothetical protein [Lachnospiraceae bacterium]
MYHNVNIEMVRARIKQGELAKELGITQSTLSLKLNGKSELSLGECIHIKRILRSNLSIEELFSSEELRPRTG